MKKVLCAGVALAALMPFSALAQTSDSGDTAKTNDATTVIVTGIRASLRSALAEKRNAPAVVDSITAEEAGKFPDTNVSESLQRVPGVAIQRNAGEGQFITVRGLGPEFNNVLLNGRTLPTDNQGREFSFDVLSADLISRADVYKTSLPELTEGGIGATVNITTTRPLDTRGTHASLNLYGSYDSMTKDFTPNFSGVYSYANPDHTFGVAASLSYTDRESKQDSVQTDIWVNRPATVVTGSESSVGLPASAASTQSFLMPSNLGFHQEAASRKRTVGSLTFQYKPNADWLITVDTLYSHLDQKMTDSIYSAYFNPAFINPVIGSDGTVQSFTRPGTTFVNNNPALASQVGASQNDNIVTTNNRLANTYVFGANAKWNVSDTLHLEGDLSYSRATGTSVNPYVVIGEQSVNGQTFDLNPGGKTPILTIPDTVTDPSLMRSHYTGVSGDSISDDILDGQLSAKWTHEAGYFRSLSAGIEYSDRQKIDNYSASPDGCAYCGYTYPANATLLQLQSFSGFIGGVQVPVAAHFTYDPNAVIAWLQEPVNLAQSSDPALAESYAGGPISPQAQPGGTINVTEKVTALYADSYWGGDRWSGNAGVRIVNVQSRSIGYGTPLLTAITNYPADSGYIYTMAPPPN
ncbi:TonB-dependent receptor [Asticcacaulis sp. EMRT-3]|uniref:TonB-dependent receptor n=1 Tax=Asticcacaulis sp. EMRT-3 TaxID=3040349 RepID=UPI0024AF3568|nr:TonB-dependent receptor [Asticcacaulis sp. EMRT-3]MDI7775762.1 TonB-dependent receptor [Asticcacaulis sp. EMRT-3]